MVIGLFYITRIITFFFDTVRDLVNYILSGLVLVGTFNCSHLESSIFNRPKK
jgi:uncharacterized membrane protein